MGATTTSPQVGCRRGTGSPGRGVGCASGRVRPTFRTMSLFEIVGLVIVGVGFLGLIAYVANHARQWDDE